MELKTLVELIVKNEFFELHFIENLNYDYGTEKLKIKNYINELKIVLHFFKKAQNKKSLTKNESIALSNNIKIFELRLNEQRSLLKDLKEIYLQNDAET